MLTKDELQNTIALIEIGAKAASVDKPLVQSAEIQTVALGIISRIQAMHSAKHNQETANQREGG